MSYKAVFFDFDGTLFDSSAGIYASLRAAFAECALPEPTDKELFRFIGPPVRQSLREFYSLSDETENAFIKAYRRAYSGGEIYNARLYDGVSDVLSELFERGVLLGTASSKPLGFIRLILKRFGLEKYFSFVDGVVSDDIPREKSDIINTGAEYFCLDKADCLMVGDRKFDIDGAKNAGVSSCGVLWGFGSRTELCEHNADFIISSPHEISDIVFGKNICY